jgi:hypothetical protein
VVVAGGLAAGFGAAAFLAGVPQRD